MTIGKSSFMVSRKSLLLVAKLGIHVARTIVEQLQRPGPNLRFLAFEQLANYRQERRSREDRGAKAA